MSTLYMKAGVGNDDELGIRTRQTYYDSYFNLFLSEINCLVFAYVIFKIRNSFKFEVSLSQKCLKFF